MGSCRLNADCTGGEFTTPALIFSGGHLILNVNTSAGGHVRVEVQDPSGQPLAGFSAQDSVPINGNFIQKAVSWHGDPALGTWAGKPVRLRFAMRDAKLYSFKFD